MNIQSKSNFATPRRSLKSLLILCILQSLIVACSGSLNGSSVLGSNSFVIESLAGANGNRGYLDGPRLSAFFNYATGITTDGTDLFIADANGRAIRKIAAASGEVTTIAGQANVSGSADGVGTLASFSYPTRLTYTGGNLYVVDAGNNTIRKIVIATGAVSTFAGLAGNAGLVDGIGSIARFNFGYRGAIASDGTFLYVADKANQKIRKIDIATQNVTTIATHDASMNPIGIYFNRSHGLVCSGGMVYVSEDGSGRVAELNPSTGEYTILASGFNFAAGLTTDGTYLYLAQAGNHNVAKSGVIYKIKISDQTKTVFSGKLDTWGLIDGDATSARYRIPGDITILGGFAYIVDEENGVIRQMSLANGSVTTYAGVYNEVKIDGSVDGIGVQSKFYLPTGVVSDGTNLYVADSGNNTIRKIVIATQVVTTFAGSDTATGTTDGVGLAARFKFNSGNAQITFDGTYLYVSDPGNSVVRKINKSTAAVTTLTSTSSLNVTGLATDGTSLFMVVGNTIQQMSLASGVVTLLAGDPASGYVDGTGPAARFTRVEAITTDGVNLYVSSDAKYIRKIVIATGVVTTIAGSSSGGQNGPALSAKFDQPVSLVYLSNALYLQDYWNTVIRKVDLNTNTVSTLVGSTFGYNILGYYGNQMATDGTNLYATLSMTNQILKYDFSVKYLETLAGAAPAALYVDWRGASSADGKKGRSTVSCAAMVTVGNSIYCADNYTNTVRRISRDGTVTTFAGSAGTYAAADGISTDATFNYIGSIATDGTNLYVCDAGQNTISKIDMGTLAVTTIAGDLAGSSGTADGVGTSARFNFSTTYSCSIAIYGQTMYVADPGNFTIRKMLLTDYSVTTFAGIAGTSGSADGASLASTFSMGWSPALAVSNPSLYLTDTNNHTVRKIDLIANQVTTIAGTAGVSGSVDGMSTAARLTYPAGITIYNDEVYVVDSGNSTIRKIAADGAVTTFAGVAGSAAPSSGLITSATTLSSPTALSSDASGIYLSNYYSVDWIH